LSNESDRYLISAIISTYNSARFIRGKIEDLLQQTIFDKLEIVIVNSGSQQNEEVIIKEYIEKYPNIKYIRTKERETIYKAWNRGIKISSGKYITNSNTDDRLKEDALEIMANFLNENDDVAMVYADQIVSRIENERFCELKKIEIINFPDYKTKYLLERCIIGSQPMWHSSLHFKDNFWFDDDYEVCGDHDFELRIARKYKIFHLNEALGLFFKSPQKKNKEYENLERNLGEVRRIQKNHTTFFINNLTKDELNKLKIFYGKYLYIPLPLLFLIKIGMKLVNVQYPRNFFHSVGFIYYFNIILLRKMNETKKAIKVAKRYMRYKKSDLVLLALNMEL
jgi:glycosyltransferase involved in cell wall biosynthesis